MSNRLLKTVTLLAFTAFSTLALADDPPARVGRVALAQGQVGISGDTGAPAAPAQVNWPVTSHNTITTGPGARTELRIGSTSVRLDGGSALEVTELDDDNLRLRLHYGSASVRIVNADVVNGFSLETPQARVRMRQPGRLRVDAERVQDTSTVEVFDGVAQVEGGGADLTVRAGRRADVQDDDVRTAQASRDAFDDWSFARDQYEDRSQSTRYVASEMTGYEDLDRYGAWRNDAEYGALWVPSVASTWVPYRDGSWTWIEPWGWTWVDNAPWGYAPFHYGRWVYVNQRWAWAPGRHDHRPVWAPALVGWVGGAGWNLAFHGHDRIPAQGWYPLSPHDRFVPWYRAPDEHLRWWNRNLHHDGRRDHDRDHDRRGLTVVPHDAFGHRDRVDVPHTARTAPPPVALQNAPSAPPPPRAGHERYRLREDGRERDRDRFERGQHVPVLTAPPVLSAVPQPRQPVTVATPPPGQAAPLPAPQPRQPVTITTAPPVLPGQQVQGEPWPRGRHEGREAFEDGRRQRPFQRGPIETSTMSVQRPQAAPAPGTVIASPPMQQGPAAGTAIASPPMLPAPMPPAGFAPRPERGHRGDGDFGGRMREAGAMPHAVAVPPQPVAPPQPAAPPMRAPMPMAQPAPPPPAAAAPAPAPAAAAAREEHRHGGREGNVRQQER